MIALNCYAKMNRCGHIPPRAAVVPVTAFSSRKFPKASGLERRLLNAPNPLHLRIVIDNYGFSETFPVEFVGALVLCSGRLNKQS